MRQNPTPYARISTVLMDVDGVLTDGFVLATESGELLRRMQIKDGYALKYAMEQGLRIGVISGGRSEGVRRRLELLGIHEVHTGVGDKLPVYEDIRARLGLTDAEVCYIGDDMPDLPILQRVGLAVAPPDAVAEVLAAVHTVTRQPGGYGCVREVLEAILQTQGRWHNPHTGG